MHFLERFIRRLRHWQSVFSDISLYNTLYFNFRVFPWRIACKLPVKVGARVMMQQLRKGCIELSVPPRRFMISIGIAKYPTFPDKGSYTLIRLSPHEGCKLKMGGDIHIRTGCSLIVSRKGHLTIGSDCFFNHNTLIYCTHRITIGKRCRVGWSSQIYDTNFHFMYDETKPHIISSPYKAVELGDNVWIGNSTIVAGRTKLPPRSIVAARSYVNKDLTKQEPGSSGYLFAGAPAVLKRSGLYRILNEQKEYEYYQTIEREGLSAIALQDDFSLEAHLKNA